MDFKPTDQQRFSLSIVAGAGQLTHEEIALGLGITQWQLKEYFKKELVEGAYKRRQEVIEATYHAALKGNVAAAKAYLKMVPKVAAPPLPKPPKSDKPEGKKAQANAAAVTAQKGTDWDELLTRTVQ